jgi:uncharacterized protein with PIN domain
MNGIYNSSEAIKAQAQYCKDKQVPHFAPQSGRCWSCGQDIYSTGRKKWAGRFEGESTGISVEKASRELVTGCPHCFRSYCD